MYGNQMTTALLDVWKVAMMLFIVASIFELVVVSCIASIGRSRRLARCFRRRRTRRSHFATEPVYEELNDLRHRTTKYVLSRTKFLKVEKYVLSNLTTP